MCGDESLKATKKPRFNVEVAKVIGNAKNESCFACRNLKINHYPLRSNSFWHIPAVCLLLHLVQNTSEILTLAFRQPPMLEQMDLLYEKEQQMPGSVHYAIQRYNRQPGMSVEDTGGLVYHPARKEEEENYLELKVCVTGNVCCRAL